MKLRLAVGMLAGLILAGGMATTAQGAPDEAPAGKSVHKAAPCISMPEPYTDYPAYNKRTGYEVKTSRGRIHLRHGWTKDRGKDCPAMKRTWAAVAEPTNTSMYIKLEIDTNSNRVANLSYTRKISTKKWTVKSYHHVDMDYMRACVVKDPKQACNSAYATSWWPV